MLKINEAYQSILESARKIYSERESVHIAKIILEDIYKVTNPNKDALLPSSNYLIEDICQKIEQQQPVQYITELAYFYELPFYVNADVLIPRPETEELVYQILGEQQFPQAKVSILDIGTGSGCIPISIKNKRQNWKVWASDVSAEALIVAEKNALTHNSNVTFIHNDILNRSAWSNLPCVDIIVSNPPYITFNEKKVMPQHVLEWEPHLALFSGNSALLFYETIADFALEYLNPNGVLFFEINEFHGKATSEMMLAKGFQKVEMIQDMSGKDRMIRAVAAVPVQDSSLAGL